MDTLVIKPRMSEKSYALSSSRVYVFDVPTTANKLQVAEAVSTAYDVEVTNVRTATIKGKQKRLYRNKRWENGARSDYKKAYVTIKAGQSIPIFAAIEEAEAEEAKAAEKADKAKKKADKKAKKEEK